MKLATLKSKSRDGQLVVVSRDLSHYLEVADIAPSLQVALDHWAEISPRLQQVSDRLNNHRPPNGQRFNQYDCASPLPRAFQWADGSAYVNHVELVRKARGAEIPDSFWTDPLMYQGGSDTFLGPYDDIQMATEDWGIDFEAEIAIITDDTPMGVSADDAEQHIVLMMLVNDVSLRNLIPPEMAKGFGFFHSKPSSAFSPVAITPDELGDSWRAGKVNLPLVSALNSQAFGRPEAGHDMTFNFPQLVAHAAKTRKLAAGCIIGSGTVSNKQDNGPGKTIADGGLGYSCIAEIRMIETIADGAPKTPFMRFGDQVRIEMNDRDGHSLFGRIEQTVTRCETAPQEHSP